MDNDDARVGRLLTRREALTLLGVGSVGFVTGCASDTRSTDNGTLIPGCVVRPQQTEGPYFVDEKLNRSDIRPDPATGAVKAGAPLVLTFNVSRISGSSCTPLPNAYVDVWHCDAAGVYSDVRDPGFVTTGQKFLRGYQVTDSSGMARFTTIYPGWYQGRAVHVHFKIHINASVTSGYVFTSQLYFDDALTDKVHAQQPYASKGRRTLRNSGDGIFTGGGSQLLLSVAENAGNYSSAFDIGLAIA